MVDDYFEWLNQEMVYYGWAQFVSLFSIEIRVPLVVTLSNWSTLHLQNSQIQTQNALSIPWPLVRFLANWHFTFVGVNNISIIRWLLLIQYDMNISNRVALFELVGEYYWGLQEQMYEELHWELRQDIVDDYFEWLNQEMVYYGWT